MLRRRWRAGLHAAAPAEPRRRRPAVRGRADHRRRLGQRRRGRAGRRGRGTSTPSRSTRSSTRSAGPTIPTAPTTTRGSRSTSTTAASFVRKTDREVRPDRLRPGRLAGAALGLFEPAAGELPVHRAGVPRHQGAAQARRRLRDVQLLPPGLGRRPAGDAWPRRSSAPSRSSSRCPTRRQISPATTRAGTSPSCSPASTATRTLEAIRRELVERRVLLAQQVAPQQRRRSTATARTAPAAGRRAQATGSKIGPAEVETAGDRPSADRRLAVPLPPRADDPRR